MRADPLTTRTADRIDNGDTTMGKPDPGAEGPDRPQAKAEARAAGTGSRDDRLKDMQARLQDKFRHSPVVLEQQAQRAEDIQLRIADWITGFAGSMNFV
jgi:hypothetical protein